MKTIINTKEELLDLLKKSNIVESEAFTSINLPLWCTADLIFAANVLNSEETTLVDSYMDSINIVGSNTDNNVVGSGLSIKQQAILKMLELGSTNIEYPSTIKSSGIYKCLGNKSKIIKNRIGVEKSYDYFEFVNVVTGVKYEVSVYFVINDLLEQCKVLNDVDSFTKFCIGEVDYNFSQSLLDAANDSSQRKLQAFLDKQRKVSA